MKLTNSAPRMAILAILFSFSYSNITSQTPIQILDVHTLSDVDFECGGPDEDAEISMFLTEGMIGASLENYSLESGYFIETSNNEAFYICDIVSTSNPNNKWHLDLHLIDKRNYSDWTNQMHPTGYKDDCSLAGESYLDWMFYYINTENSYLIGDGNFEGSWAQISYMPTNGYYGFQKGMHANNASTGLGASGWCGIEGVLFDSESDNPEIGQEFTAYGDFIFNHSPCQGEECCYSGELYQSELDYEAISITPFTCGCAGDSDDNGKIDVRDLLKVSTNFGCESNCEGDANHDGIVNVFDVMAVTSNYGLTCPN